jgi:hypothetical protein
MKPGIRKCLAQVAGSAFGLLAWFGAVSAVAQTPPAPEPFVMRATSPLDRSYGAARDLRPNVTFSQDIDRFSVGNQPLTLTPTQPGPVLSGQHSIDGKQLSMTLNRRLLPLAGYRMQWSGSLRSVSGVPLSGPTTSLFTTADGRWQDPTTAHDGANLKVSGLDVQGVRSGTGAVVAWYSHGEPGIRVSQYSAATKSWSAPQLISGQGGTASEPQMVTDGQGHVIVAWSQLNPYGYRVIWTARFNPIGAGFWEAPRVASHADGSHNTLPRLASDGAGRVVLAWRRSDGAVDSVWTAHAWSTTSHQWSVPSREDSALAPAGAIGSVAVGVSTHLGRVVVAWSARSNAVNTIPVIWARAGGYGIPAGHSAPRIISNANGDPLVEPSVSVDGAGTGWVAWRQYGPGQTAYPTFSNVQVTRINAYGWQPAVWVSDLYAQARHVRIASNRAPFGADRTWVTWVEPQRGGGVYVSQLTPSGALPATMIGLSAIDGFHRSNLVVDDAGNVMVAWGQQASTPTLMAARYAANTGTWSVPDNLDPRTASGQAYGASLSVDDAGDLFAAWMSHEVIDPVTGDHRTPILTRRFE